jgi:hypothetical protein
MILHFGHIFLTEGRTFIAILLIETSKPGETRARLLKIAAFSAERAG